MKIKPEHLVHIKKHIDGVLAKYNSKNELVELYESREFARSNDVKDLQKRFCFDLLYATGLTIWICDNVYTYANDEHLYTALKAICPKLKVN